ncbi:MAG: class I SAM-dependent methyltransferase [Verrucomicrobia bacterium]|nr:class I SAM-dependent methyltransferase [Verrucomicrobiota bacterium]
MTTNATPHGGAARACPVCDARSAGDWLTKGDMRLVRCGACGMVYAAVVAPELASGNHYALRAAAHALSPDKLEADYAPVRYERELRLFRRHCRSGAVLDVGCSTGGFLHQLEQRWPGAYQPTGTDVSGPALDVAQARGVPVVRGPFLEADLGGPGWDAVTFWAVMEHLAEPKRYLRRAAALLRPGGWCFVLVPNVQSLAMVLLGAGYRYVMEEHVNYFGPRTLRRFAAQEPAFQCVALQSTHFNPVVIWQDRRRGTGPVPEAERARLLRRTTAWKQARWLAPARWVYAAVERMLGRAGLADNLAIVLRKRLR